MHPERKICPRCGNILDCNNYNILKCACIEVPLNDEARHLIAEKYLDCLCISCLKEFAAITSKSKASP